MSIRDELRRETPVIIKTVVYGEKTYTLQGDGSADLMNTTYLLKQAEIDLRRKHWNAIPQVGKELDDTTIRQALLIHKTLRHEENEIEYDEIEIAELSVKNGPLFLMLAASALECVGTFDQAAAGNLKAPTVTNQNLTVGAAKETENLPAS